MRGEGAVTQATDLPHQLRKAERRHRGGLDAHLFDQAADEVERLREADSTDRMALLLKVIAEAQKEWNMQATRRDEMSEVESDARLIGKLHSILLVAGSVPGHEWEMHRGDE
jgi:hypothetical protein